MRKRPQIGFVITNLDTAVSIQDDVLQFQISMDDIVLQKEKRCKWHSADYHLGKCCSRSAACNASSLLNIAVKNIMAIKHKVR